MVDKQGLRDLLLRIRSLGILQPPIPDYIDPASYSAHERRMHTTTDESSWQSLLYALGSFPELEFLNDSMLVMGNSSRRIDFNMLGQWLLACTAEDKVDIAIESLFNFSGLDSTPGYDVMALAGVNINRAFQLSDKIQICPFWQLPDCTNKELLQSGNSFLGLNAVNPAFAPTAAFIAKTNYYPKTIPIDDQSRTLHNYKSFESSMQDACRLLTLIGPSTPLPLLFWSMPESWIPCFEMLGGGGTGPAHDLLSIFPHMYSDNDINEAQKLYNYYTQAKPDIRNRIRIPLERLNLAIRRRSLAEKAIDLGIALESLLLSELDKNDPISFPFRLRGAWLLASNNTERKILYKQFRTIYDLRSSAAHKGNLSDNIKIDKQEIKTQEFLYTGCCLCADVIKHIISTNEIPIWDDLILGRLEDRGPYLPP